MSDVPANDTREITPEPMHPRRSFVTRIEPGNQGERA
jgi:hypothetical protein